MGLSICGIGTAAPVHRISQERACQLAQCGQDEKHRRLLGAIYRKTTIRSRGSVLLDQDDGDTPFYDACTASTGPGTQARMERFAREAGPLAATAARLGLEQAGCGPEAVTHLITVSCTGFFAPGLDWQLIQTLGLRSTTQRINIGFMGCHATLNAMQAALAIADSNPQATILLCCTELCSLHFQVGSNGESLLPNALFADGAACLVARCSQPGAAWVCTSTGSCLLPQTRADMSWEIGDHGFVMTLSRRVPELIAANLSPWLSQWLGGRGLSCDAIGSWAVHPGGPGILEAISKTLKLPPEALNVSRQVLAEFGNMSSPTILFIVDRLRRQKAPLPCVMLAFGPGLAMEAALLE